MVKRKGDLCSEGPEGPEGNNAAFKKSRKADEVVELANALDKDALLRRTNTTWPDGPFWTEENLRYESELLYAEELTKDHLHTCLALIEKTSRHDYEPSSFGWHPQRKMREMKEQEMRYLLVYTSPKHQSNGFQGFMSFMFTHDSSPAVPVLYIYEIHLEETARGRGLGKVLMRYAEVFARELKMEKVMLTCFKSNTSAYSFYERLGYGIDPCSPRDIKTRRKVSKSDYVIMSLDLRRASEPPQTTAGAEQCEDKQVTEDSEDKQVTEDSMVHPRIPSADMLSSSDEIFLNTKRCIDQLESISRDSSGGVPYASTATDASKRDDAINVGIEVEKLRAMIASFETRFAAIVEVQVKAWKELRRLNDHAQWLALRELAPLSTCSYIPLHIVIEL